MTISAQRQGEDAVRSEAPPAADDARPSARSLPVTVTPRTLWLAVTLLALAAGVGFVVARGISVFLLLFTAIIIAEGLRPIMNGLHARWHVSQSAAVLLMYLVLLLVLGGSTWLLIRALVGQISTFANALPELDRQVARLLADLQRFLGNSPQVASALKSLQGQGGALAQGALQTLGQVPQMLGTMIFDIMVVAAMAFFWLTGVGSLRPFVVGLLPADDQPVANEVFTDIGHRLGGYVRGTIINSIVIGVLTTLGCWLLGAPFPLLLGLVAMLTGIIPYFGPWISGAIAVIIVLPLAGPLKAVEVIAFYCALQTIVGNSLTPIIMMDTVNINPLLVILSVLLGTALLGIPGAILGVPAMAILQVIVVRVLAPIARRASARVPPREQCEPSSQS